MSSPAWQFQMGDPDALNSAPAAASCLLLSVFLPLVIAKLVGLDSVVASSKGFWS